MQTTWLQVLCFKLCLQNGWHYARKTDGNHFAKHVEIKLLFHLERFWKILKDSSRSRSQDFSSKDFFSSLSILLKRIIIKYEFFLTSALVRDSTAAQPIVLLKGKEAYDKHQKPFCFVKIVFTSHFNCFEYWEIALCALRNSKNKLINGTQLRYANNYTVSVLLYLL